MAEETSSPNLLDTTCITVTATRIQNLRGQRGDNVNVKVKFEFGELVLGESTKAECSVDVPTQLDFSAPLTVPLENNLTLDDIASKPVVCTVTEILPREKRQREERMVVLGQSIVDLFPLLTGNTTSLSMTLPINPTPGSPLESLPADADTPTIDIKVSAKEQLLSDDLLEKCNFMTVTMESMFSPPDSWNASSTHYQYIGTMPIPLTSDKDNIVVFAGGSLKTSSDKDNTNRQKKWAIPGAAIGSSVYMSDKNVPMEPVEEEKGDLKSADAQEHRWQAEHEKNRVIWNMERRSYLDTDCTSTLKERISKHRYWPVEIFRAVAPGSTKKPKDDEISCHGVAYVDMSPLLYPGVKRVRGAYLVAGFKETEMAEKTYRKETVAHEAIKIANSILTRHTASPYSRPRRDERQRDGRRAHGKLKIQPSTMRVSETATSDPEPQPVSTDSLQYVDAKSYVMMEITLQRPLVKKRSMSELAVRVADCIPPRPRFPKIENSAQKAVDDYHSEIAVVAEQILNEYRTMFGDSLADLCCSSARTSTFEDNRRQLLYHLNTSGKYVSFKERLKYYVVKIVREKYLQKSRFKDPDMLQSFLNELYIYLVDEMHVALNKYLDTKDVAAVPKPVDEDVQLKHFAQEAEINNNFDLAAKYYQERIARDSSNADYWFDYGGFNLFINDLPKADECFRQCVSINQKHHDGLVMSGIVSALLEKYEIAETLLETATTVQPNSIIAWTVFGLFYDMIDNSSLCKMALDEASRLNTLNAIADAKETSETSGVAEAAEPEAVEGAAAAAAAEADIADARDEPQDPDAPSPVPETPPPVVDGASKEVKEIMEEEIKSKGVETETPVSLPVTNTPQTPASEQMRRPSDRITQESGKSATKMKVKSMSELPVQRVPVVVPSQTVFMQTALFLLDVRAVHFAEKALAYHIVDRYGGADIKYHIALARLNLQKQLMDATVENLDLALRFDCQNVEAWTLMGHTKYLTDDYEHAKSCYERVLSLVSDCDDMHAIYLRLGSIYLVQAKLEEARNTFLLACKRSPTCVSWLGVGIACYRMDDLDNAEDALIEANIINNLDPEVWAYLSLICLKTNRKVEAEQTYKFVVKLELNDENVLKEIHDLQQEVGFGNPEF